MKISNFLSLVLCVLSMLTTASLPARADLQLVLSATSQNAGPGTTVTFSGTATNTSASSQLYLNNLQVTFGGSESTYATANTNTFFSNVPGILLPNETYAGPLFQVTLSANAPAADYPGVITILGGSNITATTALVSVPFAIRCPSLQFTATIPDAAEFGPVVGKFRIVRSGGTDTDLPVQLNIQGTAANGVAYVSIPSTTTIPNGSAAVSITVTPIPDNIAEGDRTVILSVVSASTYQLGSPSSDVVTIHDKPIDAWRLANFGALANSAQAADGADPSGAGITNVTKFALNLSVSNPDRTALPAIDTSSGYLTMSFLPNPQATDLSYAVTASTDLQSWSAGNVQEITPANPTPPGLRTFRYQTPITIAPRVFLRLEVTRLDLSP